MANVTTAVNATVFINGQLSTIAVDVILTQDGVNISGPVRTGTGLGVPISEAPFAAVAYEESRPVEGIVVGYPPPLGRVTVDVFPTVPAVVLPVQDASTASLTTSRNVPEFFGNVYRYTEETYREILRGGPPPPGIGGGPAGTEPVVGLLVELFDNQERQIDKTTTDALGEFRFATRRAGPFVIRFPRTHIASGISYRLPDNWTELNFPGAAANWPPPAPPPASQEVQITTSLVYELMLGSVSGFILDGGIGLPGVPVTCRITAFESTFDVRAMTDAEGEFEFNAVLPGRGQVLYESPVFAAGRDWELTDPTRRSVDVQIEPGKDTRISTVRYVREQHVIRHVVIDGNDAAVPGVLVELYSGGRPAGFPLAPTGGGALLFQQVSNGQGFVEFNVRTPNVYYLAVYSNGFGVPPIIEEVSVNSTVEVRTRVPTAGGGSGGSAPVPVFPSELRVTGGAGIDNEYPLLTTSIGGGPSSGGNGIVSGDDGPLAQIAARAVSQALGWKFKSGDTKGFTNALKQRFDLREMEGHIEWTYKPGNYLLASDLSADKPITGAQASLLAQMRNATDRGKELLDGLYSLRQLADDEDGPALKSLILQLLERMVQEMSTPGGPRTALVDSLFDQLIGTHSKPVEGDSVSGALGTLRDEFGLRFGRQRNLVNTVDEEENLTSFRILVDYVSGVCVSWNTNRAYFDRSASVPFFGTQLVHISRQLSVISSEVEQTRRIFDSVFLDQAVRLTTRIPIRGDGASFALRLSQPPATTNGGASRDAQAAYSIYSNRNAGLGTNTTMSIEELLTWVQSFAGQEGPEQIENGGKYGAQKHFLPEARQLRNLLYAATNPAIVGQMPPAYRTARVQGALKGLASQLDEAAALAVGLDHPIPSQEGANVSTTSVSTVQTPYGSSTSPGSYRRPAIDDDSNGEKNVFEDEVHAPSTSWTNGNGNGNGNGKSKNEIIGAAFLANLEKYAKVHIDPKVKPIGWIDPSPESITLKDLGITNLADLGVTFNR